MAGPVYVARRTGTSNAAREQQEVLAWVQVVAERAPTFGPAEQRATLRGLGAVVTVWRADYQHPDGWPQRYQIVLHWTGFTTRQPVTLPPACTPDANNVLTAQPIAESSSVAATPPWAVPMGL
jgi:hypothetical protein